MNLPYAKKALGQHWLHDKSSLKSMVQSAHVSANDIVLEIGPGTGLLTDQLAQTGAKIIALEYDKQRYNQLIQKYKNTHNIQVIYGDIRKFDFNSLPKSYKIVANIPYYLTTNLLRLLVDTKNKPQLAVLLVQKEVAQRVVASAGNLSQVAIFTQIYYLTKLGKIVPAQLFVPPPKVDSQIIILQKWPEPLIKTNEYFTKVIKAGFSQKRKKLITSLADGLGISKQQIKQSMLQANVNLDVRAQELSLDQWQKLTITIRILIR